MLPDEIARRLEAAGVPRPPRGSLVRAVRRSWCGRHPVERDVRGKWGLDLFHRALQEILAATGIRREATAPLPPVPDPKPAADEEPLSDEEVLDAFGGKGLHSAGCMRLLAAILDATGRAMSVEELEGALSGLTGAPLPLAEEAVRRWKRTSDLLRVETDGRLALDPSSPGLPRLRRAVRERGRPALLRRVRGLWLRGRLEVAEALAAEEHRRDERAAARVRRAVLRAVPRPEAPRALALLDGASLEVRTFVGAEVSEAPGFLEGYHLLAGAGVRDTLAFLGLEPDRWRILDLTVPRGGFIRNLVEAVYLHGPDPLVRGTIPDASLSDAVATARLLARGRGAGLARLARDARLLHALYRYGMVHGYVRARIGETRVRYEVQWKVPGDPILYGALRRASDAGLPVEVSFAPGPRGEDFGPARESYRVERLTPRRVLLRNRETARETTLDDIHAARVLGGLDQ